jgi:hypothetical protein
MANVNSGGQVVSGTISDKRDSQVKPDCPKKGNRFVIQRLPRVNRFDHVEVGVFAIIHSFRAS